VGIFLNDYLILKHDPLGIMEAATKQYVDASARAIRNELGLA
jgi:hypothetical protein